jgi:cytidylate kinase
MEKKIITISREFGSGGRFIGEEIAKKLGYEFYDKTIIGKIAEETGFSEKFIEEKAEYAPTKNIFSYAFVGRNSSGMSIEDYLNSVQRKIILDAVEKGPCVIVGRCADYILKDREDSVNVFIHGEMKNKLERIERIYNLSTKEAEKLIQETDRKRSINYKYYTEQIWGKSQNYTLTLNSSKLGYDKVIDIICNL